MIRVVLDTNVVISALLASDGLPATILDLTLQGKVSVALEVQRACRRQTGDATPSDQDLGLARHRGCWPRAALAQQMPAFGIDAGEAAADFGVRLATQQRQRRTGNKVATFHGLSLRPGSGAEFQHPQSVHPQRGHRCQVISLLVKSKRRRRG